MRRSLYDKNNTLLLDGISFLSSTYNIPDILGFDASNIHLLSFPTLKMSISGASETFNSSNITINFRDEANSIYTNITRLGTFFSSSESGWVEYVYDFSNGNSLTSVLMSYVSVNNSFVFSSSAARIYTFKDVRLEFKEPLTNAGVSFYDKINNQNNEDIISYINVDVGKKIE